MKSNKPSLVIVTNLYPLPWEPNRATFNRQQFELLKDDCELNLLIPIAFGEWFKHRDKIKQTDNLRYVPYFYLPKIGRRFYSVMMFFSILLHSGFWLKKKKPSVMFASWAFPEAVATSWLAQLYKCRFFFKVHGSDINLHGQIPARAKQIVSAANKAQAILSVSQALATEMVTIGVPSDKIRVIYNGVNHEKFGGEHSKPIADDYLLYVGNLKHDKGVIELIEGFYALASEFPNLKLYFAGSGIMKDKLTAYIANHQLEERVKLLGNLNHDELPQWMVNAKALCLPSYNEGVPNVVLESMAAGTPVLATTVGGIPEVVNEDICGQLIPAKSSEAVTSGLRKLLSASWSSTDIKKHAAQFSWEKNKQQLVAMLRL